jgi:hypothetical protein
MKRTGATGFVTAVTMWLGATGALATSPHDHRVPALGGSCQGSASAIAQYCEVIPTPGGGEHPAPGAPTLLSSLPAGRLGHLTTNPRLRPLLRIPAPAGPPQTGVRGVARPNAGTSPGGADSSSLWTPLVLVLGLIALLLGGIEVARRRWLSGATG